MIQNIILVGEKFSPNLGDGVIFQTVKSIIKHEFPDCKIYDLDLSGRVAYSDDTDWLMSGLQRISKRLISHDYARAGLVNNQFKSIIDSVGIDGIIFAGGQLFMDYFSLTISKLVEEADTKSIPVIFNACGIGHNNDSYQNKLRKAFARSCVKAISVRDNMDAFTNIYPSTKGLLEIVMDPVLEMGRYSSVKRPSSRVKRMGINLMSPWVSGRGTPDIDHDYNKAIVKQTIELCDEFNIDWGLYCNGAIYDFDYINNLCSELDIQPHRLADRPVTPTELVSLIGSYSTIVGFRMHTHIIANSLGIPTLGFIWDHKLLEYARFTNQVEYFLEMSVEAVENLNRPLRDLISRNHIAIEEDGMKFSSTFLIKSINGLKK